MLMRQWKIQIKKGSKNDYITFYREVVQAVNEATVDDDYDVNDGPTKEYVCENAKPRGNEDKYDCNTLSFIINKQCLVYSLGIGYEWSFDNTMVGLNCEVHLFDPRDTWTF